MSVSEAPLLIEGRAGIADALLNPIPGSRPTGQDPRYNGYDASRATRARLRARPAEIDIARVLRPIPGPSPTGVSLRYESEYDRIREARRDEDPALPQGVWLYDLKRADWGQVIELCVDSLSERSKDVQIACWLLDALVHRRGFAGLAEGLGALVALCDKFWPDLFPAIDDGDMAARLAPIEWIDEKLPQVVYTLPLTCSGTPETISYSWTDYVNAQRQEIARSGNSSTQNKDDAATLEVFLASEKATPTSFYEELREQLDLGLDWIGSAAASLDRHCGKEAPGLVHLREALADVQGFVNAVLALREDTAKSAVPASETLRVAASNASAPFTNDLVTIAPAAPPLIEIHSRDEAYSLLMEIADYLFTVEPHSPTPYIVQRAASWGMMPLHQLLVELTKGSNDLATLFELLGIGRDGEKTNGHGTG
jgi:type VI secretion system protein ImpA